MAGARAKSRSHLFRPPGSYQNFFLLSSHPSNKYNLITHSHYQNTPSSTPHILSISNLTNLLILHNAFQGRYVLFCCCFSRLAGWQRMKRVTSLGERMAIESCELDRMLRKLGCRSDVYWSMGRWSLRSLSAFLTSLTLGALSSCTPPERSDLRTSTIPSTPSQSPR